MTLHTFHYAVVRAVPDLSRDEAVNIGLVVLADDGTFADARFADIGRVRQLDPRVNLRSIEVFADGLRASLPVSRNQSFLVPPRTSVSITRLEEWSREFGGIVRVTPPRVMLGTDGQALSDRLFAELVAPKRKLAQARTTARVLTRGDLVRELDHDVTTWQIDDQLVGRDRHVRGARADHLIDRTFFRPDRTVGAIVQAISFQASELADIYAARATLIVASEDLREGAREPVGAYALYADAPADRAGVLHESAELFSARQITPVDHRELANLRREVASRLFA
jgi:hypothetical protein